MNHLLTSSVFSCSQRCSHRSWLTAISESCLRQTLSMSMSLLGSRFVDGCERYPLASCWGDAVERLTIACKGGAVQRYWRESRANRLHEPGAKCQCRAVAGRLTKPRHPMPTLALLVPSRGQPIVGSPRRSRGLMAAHLMLLGAVCASASEPARPYHCR